MPAVTAHPSSLSGPVIRADEAQKPVQQLGQEHNDGGRQDFEERAEQYQAEVMQIHGIKLP